MAKYTIKDIRLASNAQAKVGDTVYDIKGWDYGLANDDSRVAGMKFISVTYKEDGDYPSFTIPLHHLEKVE